MSTPGTVKTFWIGFSYIPSEDYELDQNFDGAEFKTKTTNPTIKLIFLRNCCGHCVIMV